MTQTARRYMCLLVVFSIVCSFFECNMKVYAAETDNNTQEQPVTEAPAVTEAPTVTEAPSVTETPSKTESSTASEKKDQNKKTKKTTEKSNTKSTPKTEAPTIPNAPVVNGPSAAEVEQARENVKEAEENQKSAQELLDSLKNTKLSIEDYIIRLDKMLTQMQSDIYELEKNQAILEQSIQEKQQELEEAKAAQTQQYDSMKFRIQMVYESGQKRYLDVLLSATSMTDMLNKSEYISQVSLYDYNLLKQLKDAKEKVANIKQKLDVDLEANEVLQKDIKAQKEIVEQILAEKNAQVAEYEETIKMQEEEVAKYTKAKEEAESIIAAAEAAAAAAAAASAESNSSTSTYTGGVFQWPVPGNYTITSPFGNRNSPTAGASSYHRGIDIACPTGSNVVAAASGTVIVATYNYAEGNYVCIDHGGGVVTVYMHNSSLIASVGDSVTAGQTIALSGSTGVSTGPHCHFGVRVNGEYVNPMGYLQ